MTNRMDLFFFFLIANQENFDVILDIPAVTTTTRPVATVPSTDAAVLETETTIAETDATDAQTTVSFSFVPRPTGSNQRVPPTRPALETRPDCRTRW